MRRWGLRLLGTALIVYGVLGTALLGVLAASIAAPLDEIGELAESVGEWRTAALDALDEASEASRETAATVRGMDTGLVETQGATDRASNLSQGMAQSMRDLATAMSLEIFGIQPMIGLAPSFTTSAQNLDLLASDLGDITAALETTRTDADAMATNIDDLAEAIEELRLAMADSPDLANTLETRETLRLGLLALLGWLIAGSVGFILAGLGCWWVARRRPVTVRPIERLEPLD